MIAPTALYTGGAASGASDSHRTDCTMRLTLITDNLWPQHPHGPIARNIRLLTKVTIKKLPSTYALHIICIRLYGWMRPAACASSKEPRRRVHVTVTPLLKPSRPSRSARNAPEPPHRLLRRLFTPRHDLKPVGNTVTNPRSASRKIRPNRSMGPSLKPWSRECGSPSQTSIRPFRATPLLCSMVDGLGNVAIRLTPSAASPLPPRAS